MKHLYKPDYFMKNRFLLQKLYDKEVKDFLYRQ